MRYILIIASILLLSISSCSRCEGDCQNGGVCDLDSCYCPKGYFGPNCEEFDHCQSINCQNGFLCIDGSCDCEVPYYGIDCSGDMRTNYSSSSTCPFEYKPNNRVEIYGSGFGNSFWFENFVGNSNVPFTIINNSSITISRRHLGSGIYISGAGTISSDFQSIVLSYEVEDRWDFPITVSNCTTTLTRIN